MRYSKTFIPTVKEVPAEAEIPSHRLMIRAGYVRKVASGTYTYLPLGLRSVQKISQIVREEMNAAGAIEIAVPILQPAELWQKTGRDVDYGETLCKLTDRHGRQNVLAPTAEEVFTFLAAGEIKSYKQLPINLYQIGPKFRDEFRPRFGALRSREFIMKDAYSFDTDPEAVQASYQAMYDAYCRVFARCGVEYVIVEAESGEMGGSGSHQFTVPCDSGEDTIVYTADGSYAANLEKAGVDPLPAPADLDEQRAAVGAYEKVHTPGVGSIEAVCSFLGTQPEQMIKTLIYSTATDADLEKELGEYSATHGGQSQKVGSAEFVANYAVLVRGDHEVNEEKLRTALGKPTLRLQDRADRIRHHTNAEVGFAGPIGLNGAISLVIDHSVAAMVLGVTGANETDYHLKNVVPGRDFPLEGERVVVADVRNAEPGDTRDGKELQFRRGIEVGQVFKLGSKYSVKLGATFLDEDGQAKPCLMGCYGIGVNRILASAIELSYDDNGFGLPISIAPYEVEVVQINSSSEVVRAESERIYDALTAAGVDVLLDDRDARPGVKFKDADLIGIPLRVVVGERGLKEGHVEIKRRTDAKPTLVPQADAVARVQALREDLWAPLR